MDLLKEIHDVVTAHTVILEGIKDEQVKTNGRLTKVESDNLMLRGGIIVLVFLLTVGVAIAGIVARVV